MKPIQFRKTLYPISILVYFVLLLRFAPYIGVPIFIFFLGYCAYLLARRILPQRLRAKLFRDHIYDNENYPHIEAPFTRRYGWFEYSNKPSRISNFLTGQNLVVSSTEEKGLLTTYECIYSDADISHPIRFSIEEDSNRSLRVRLDYPDIFPEPPTYGHWRRLDDFLVDALLCWPDFFCPTHHFYLETTGCWRRSRWMRKLRRQFGGRKSAQGSSIDNYVIAEPYVVPLDLPSPPKWKLVNPDSIKIEASLNCQLLEDLNIPYLPRESPIEGFQGLVPYLEREDRKAYVFFKQAEVGYFGPGYIMTDLSYTYIDQDVFFTFRSNPIDGINLGRCMNYGFREFPPSREFWTTNPLGVLIKGDTPRLQERIGFHFSSPSYFVWLRVIHAVGDAWSAWGTAGRPLQVHKPADFQEYRCKDIGYYRRMISMGYCAGMVNSRFEARYIH